MENLIWVILKKKFKSATPPVSSSKVSKSYFFSLRHLSKSPIIFGLMLDARCHQDGIQYRETDLNKSIDNNSKVRLPPLTHQRSSRVIASVEISFKISNNFWTYAWFKMATSIAELTWKKFIERKIQKCDSPL
ncbi:unnamed protein product [Blepharisma stoltei]|uniref:Uncharacterized protein n=1 Tax=Blepharisma stoltei TaxID=1481888 RepID=A0AAU9JSW5_9CILI|nr:unnamed protein product [Blepharisma stoltei]